MTPPTTSDLATDLKTRGCAVCDHLAVRANGFFAEFQYSLATDENVQRDFAARLDMCPLHLWQLEAVSSPKGISTGAAPLMDELARALDDAAQHPETGTVPVPASGGCRTCGVLREAEADYLARLARLLRETAGREVYAASHGPCLRHLAALVVIAKDTELGRFLLSHAARRFENTAADMQNYAMKLLALRRESITPDEHDSWWRALAHVAGRRDLCSSGLPR